MNISEKIKKLRMENGKTQNDLSKLLDLPRYIISNWEQGRSNPSLEDLTKLADFFNCSVDFLIDREDDYILFEGMNGMTKTKNDKSALFEDVSLNADEKDLLTHFRGLGEEDKRSVLRVARSLFNEAKEENESEKIN